MAHRVFLPLDGPDVIPALGIEFACPYEIVSPAGARAVLNDPADRDFVGYLSGDDAVTGLERAGVRENREDLAEGDGSVQGHNRYSGLAWTLKGILLPDEYASTAYQAKLLAATNAMRADGLLRWYPRTPGVPPVQVRFRQQQATRVTGRRPKGFFVAGACEDPLVYSQEVHEVFLSGDAGSSAFNLGNTDVPVDLTIAGPTVSAPVLHNDTTGRQIAFNRALTSTETLAVSTNPRRPRVLLNGAPAAGLLAYLASDELTLAPGPNVLRLAGGASGRVTWRDGWG